MTDVTVVLRDVTCTMQSQQHAIISGISKKIYFCNSARHMTRFKSDGNSFKVLVFWCVSKAGVVVVKLEFLCTKKNF